MGCDQPTSLCRGCLTLARLQNVPHANPMFVPNIHMGAVTTGVRTILQYRRPRIPFLIKKSYAVCYESRPYGARYQTGTVRVPFPYLNMSDRRVFFNNCEKLPNHCFAEKLFCFKYSTLYSMPSHRSFNFSEVGL